GKVTFIGTWTGFDTEAHRLFYERLLKRSAARLRNALSDNGFIIVRQRFTDDGRGLLFAANYYNEEMKGSVIYKHPVTGESVSLPYNGGVIMWPPLRAMLSPLCLQLTVGLILLHSTSDLLGLNKEGGEIFLTLSGDRDLAGETVIEGPEASRISNAEINGVPAEITVIQERRVITYCHGHGEEMILKIVLG
ncbi:MAG: hypothetical protein PHO11_02335, partial [Bacteroidales bacterium]|nr:hypothetical protein [Bacteroidales bacterium]